ncbi:MAG: nuclear transport factor 2 family protein [Sneathiella sp.]
MTRQRNEAFIDSIIEDILYGNVEKTLACFDSNAEIHICLGNQLYTDSYAATFMGHSGITNFLSLSRQFVEFIHFTPNEYHHENNKMIVRGLLECQMTTTGSLWSSTWMQIWTMKEEKVAKLRMFADFEAAALADPVQKETRSLAGSHH